jgi:hypothetical protein
VAARDVERDDDRVADGDLPHAGADFFDDPHRLVAEDVAVLHAGRLAAVQMQVGAADRRRRDADDRIVGALELRVVDRVDAELLVAVPYDRLRASLRLRGAHGETH